MEAAGRGDDGLLLLVLPEAGLAALPAEAAPLGAAEGRARPEELVVVDPDDACVEVVGDGVAPRRVGGEDRVAEAVGRRVGERDGVGVVVEGLKKNPVVLRWMWGLGDPDAGWLAA